MEKILRYIANKFEFENHKTNFRTELSAGLATFLTLAYIFVVNPAILGAGGFNTNAVLFATVMISFLATFLMGAIAKKPFALAPGMEMNAYVVFFVINGLGFVWQQALGAVFWSGIIFLILTVTNIRMKIINSIPDKMKSGLALCVGVFLMLIALKLAGVLIYSGVTFTGVGSLFTKNTFLLVSGLILIFFFRKLKIPAAVFISIIIVSIIGYFIGIKSTQSQITISKDMLSAFGKIDLSVILNPKLWGVILILFLIDFYGSVAKLIGLTRNTTIVDKNRNLPKMKEALLIDGSATVLGGIVGTTSITVFVESGVGIAEGGRTGLTAITCSLLMLLFLVLSPLVNLVPLIATTGVLLWVGFQMFPSKEELEKYSWIDKVTVVVMVVSTIYTFAIDKALLLGALIFIGGSLFTKKYKTIDKYFILSTSMLLIGFVVSVIF